jgi:hypothetical protein
MDLPSMRNAISRRATAITPFTDLSGIAEQAAGRLGIQDNPALTLAKSDSEIAQDRRLAEEIRTHDRNDARASAESAARRAAKRRKLEEQIEDIELADELAALQARVNHRRAADPHAMTAALHRMGKRLPAALIGVAVVGTLWSGVNVQHNLFPVANFADPLYWISFGFEALISVPLIVIMATTAVAAKHGREVSRRKVIPIEAALLGLSVALNVGPHIGHAREMLEFGLAPVMVAAAVWLHPWVSGIFAGLIADTMPAPADRERHPIEIAPAA